jgi:hypothetical protein
LAVSNEAARLRGCFEVRSKPNRPPGPIGQARQVVEELRRPVFSLLEGRPLTETCTFLSYDSVREISELKHLSHMSDKVIDDYEDYEDDSD